jgi:hypothetical protein
MLLLPLLTALGAIAGLNAPTSCSVRELRGTSSYRVERIRQFVDSATMIVRARAVAELRADPLSSRGFTEPRVRFEILEHIRAPDSVSRVELRGSVVLHDDFNRGAVPYGIVRPAGQRGDCFATEYRLGAEYLLILGPQGGELTPHWKPLAPFNEQVQGEVDRWVIWVRGVAARR